MPEMMDLFITPPVTIIGDSISDHGYDRTRFCENGKSGFWILPDLLCGLPLGIGAFLCGAAYPSYCRYFGTHHMFGVLETGMLAENGKNMWIAGIQFFSKFCHVYGVSGCIFQSKEVEKTKAVALPASMSAALGITEPAIFGINLRYIRPLVCGMIGAAFGAAAGSHDGGLCDLLMV